MIATLAIAAAAGFLLVAGEPISQHIAARNAARQTCKERT